MTTEELARMLALIGVHLNTQVRTRFFNLIPEGLRNIVLRQAESIADVRRDDLSVVEQVLLTDLKIWFTDEEMAVEAESLPLRVADLFAVVLRRAQISEATEIVKRLPDALQAEVLHLIAAQSADGWERRLGASEYAALSAFSEAFELGDIKASPELSAEILHHIQTPHDIRQILTYMYEKDPDSTGYIQNYLFGFEALVKLPDKELQTVLQGVDHWDLILAMRTAPANMRRKVLGNLSQRRATMFADDEAVLEEVDDAQVEMIQHQIVDRARLLYEAGDIHTYLGSTVGHQGDDSQKTTEPLVANQALKKSALASQKNKKKRVGLGIFVTLGCLLLCFYLIRWFAETQNASTQDGRGKASLPGDRIDDEAVRGRDENVSRARSSNVGDAAVLSGRALLMTGESIRAVGEKALEVGDRVQTDGQGRASISLSDDAGQLQMESDTEVQFVEPTTNETAPPRLDLRVGNIWVKVNDPALEVTSPLAHVTASDGALYHLRITLNATTVLSVHSGTVWVQAEDGGGLHVLGVGERLKLEPGGDITRDRHAEASEFVEDPE